MASNYKENKLFQLLLVNKNLVTLLIASATLFGSPYVLSNEEVDVKRYVEDQELFFPDYSYAGYHFGEKSIPVRQKTTVVDVTEYGAYANDNKDDTASVLSALEHAHTLPGHVTLYFPHGRFILKNILKITRGNITIAGEGMGPNGTELFFPLPLSIIDKSDSLNELREYLRLHNKKQKDPEIYIDTFFSEYSWSGGVIWVQKKDTRAVPYLEKFDKKPSIVASIANGRRGQKFIELTHESNISKGDIIRIDWHNRGGKKAGIIQSIYGDTTLDIGSHHWNFPDRPLVSQPTRVKSVKGNIVEIHDPLLHDINADVPAHIASWDYIAEVGIENIAINFPDGSTYGHHVEQGFNGIYMTSVFNGWIKNVRLNNADSAILTENSANVTISNIHSYGERYGHYGIHLGSVHNFLVEDTKIFNPTVHTFSMNTKSTKSVFLRGEGFVQPTLDQHAGANHQNLYDNMTFHIETSNDENGPYYDLWYGGGAGYWQPGHGGLNTTWNTKIMVQNGSDEPIRILGRTEGPDARVIGIHGNTTFRVEYSPRPLLHAINEKPNISSLYEYQKQQRLSK